MSFKVTFLDHSKFTESCIGELVEGSCCGRKMTYRCCGSTSDGECVFELVNVNDKPDP